MPEEKVERISFFSKKQTKCPVCEASFYREELLTGRGRLVASDLTLDLHRKYEPTKKYGEVFPLIYSITVCPNCYYGVYHEDFEKLPEDAAGQLAEKAEARATAIHKIFKELDFREPRKLKEGVASYFFAMECYDYFKSETNPVFKQGLSALRAAWLCMELHAKLPGDNFDYLARVFYRKAAFLFSQVVEFEGDGTESISNVGHTGPDIDKNYGYDGILYLASYLKYYYGPVKNEEKRIKDLEMAKTTVARVFGMGKSSKGKPGVLLDMARDLYQKISTSLKSEDDD